MEVVKMSLNSGDWLMIFVSISLKNDKNLIIYLMRVQSVIFFTLERGRERLI